MTTSPAAARAVPRRVMLGGPRGADRPVLGFSAARRRAERIDPGVPVIDSKAVDKLRLQMSKWIKLVVASHRKTHRFSAVGPGTTGGGGGARGGAGGGSGNVEVVGFGVRHARWRIGFGNTLEDRNIAQ